MCGKDLARAFNNNNYDSDGMFSQLRLSNYGIDPNVGSGFDVRICGFYHYISALLYSGTLQ